MSSKWNYLIFGFGGLVAIGIIGMALLLIAPVVNIEPDERGVVLESYMNPSGEVLEPGLHWLKPGEKAQIVDVSRQTYVMAGSDSTKVKTSDRYEIEVDVSVIYAVDPNKIVELFTKWQDRYQDNLVRPITRDVMRDTLSQYSKDALFGNERLEAQQAVQDMLTKKFAENDLLFLHFEILDIR
jgi:regulator of protease activity HflC (stomatin/prohibitin superfamily)